MAGLIRTIRRRQLAKRPLPQDWTAVLQRRVPFYRRLCGREQARFLKLLRIFIWEKHFTGAGGIQITDEVRVVIAACAVRLVLHLDISYYDRLSEIIVYPFAFRHPASKIGLLGETQDWGIVVLSWPAVLLGLADTGDAHAVATHEFAHVLDRADGRFDGTPLLKSRSAYQAWAKVMSAHFLKLRKNAALERKVLRLYGAVNEAEFFAVATEAFFKKPTLMKKLTPDLYTELQDFYRIDPAGELSAVCLPSADTGIPEQGPSH